MQADQAGVDAVFVEECEHLLRIDVFAEPREIGDIPAVARQAGTGIPGGVHRVAGETEAEIRAAQRRHFDHAFAHGKKCLPVHPWSSSCSFDVVSHRVENRARTRKDGGRLK